MKKMAKTKLKKIVRNQNGQGVMEYVILTSLIGIFCLIAVKQFGTSINNRIKDMKKHLNNEISLISK